MFSNFAIFIFFYFFIISSVLGYGLFFARSLNRLNISSNFGYLGLIGIFFLCIYSYFSSIFVNHGYLHNSILLGIGFIFFLFFIINNYFSLNSKLLYFFIVFIILFISSLIYKAHDDFPYYHFPYSYILTQNNLIIGLGHFNLGFRTPSSLFYLNSLFFLPYVKYYMFMLPSVLILGFTNIILIERIFKNIELNKINYITFLCLLIFIFINIFFYRIAEHGTDKSAQILAFLLIVETLIFLNSKKDLNLILSKIYILIGLIISLKAFYVLYGVFILILFLKLLQNQKFVNTIFIFTKNNYFIPLIILFLLVLISYFFNTSCFIYPLSSTCVEQVLWSINKAEVIELNNWYEQWAKGGAGPDYRVDNPEQYISYFNWVNNWIDKYFFNKVSDFLFGLIFLLLITNIFFITSKKKEIIFPKIKILLFVLFLLFFEWFYNHPALRYGGYAIIVSIIFIFFSLRLNSYLLDNVKIKKRFITLIAITVTIFLTRNIYRINNEMSFYSYEPIKKVYYRVENSYFDISNLIEKKIINYEQCQLSKAKCTNNDKIKTKKYLNRYVFYKKK